MDALKPPVRWLESHWSEEDVLLFFELDEDGWVLRQVELQGPDRQPIAAAALAEWPDPVRDGIEAIRAYQAKYGATADQPVSRWDAGFPYRDIDRLEFDEIWRRARAFLESVG